MDGLKRLFKRSDDATAIRIRRRRAIISRIISQLPFLIVTLYFAGYLWMLAIPSPRLGRGTYIDENALQPGQVNTYWSWGDVHNADLYLAQLEALRDINSTSEQTKYRRAHFLMTEFSKLGISASTQNYTFMANTGVTKGTNAYAIISSPRTSGTEAIVISASWLSRTGEGDGTLNLRGVSTALALAGFLKRYSLWAKDIIFVVSDGYLDGMHAWLSAYHGSIQSNLQADQLKLSSGVIWTALNIDYPGHSFSHLGIFFEGLNGRLPNQDLLNSFQHIARFTGGVPVVVYDHLDPRSYPGERNEMIPSWVPGIVRDQPEVQMYIYQGKNVLRHIGYQARGRASGVHGLLHQFRIDAITLFAVPATGPHGFHAIGRIIESTLRTANNLLERLHASFFFYILTGPDRFLKIGSYLPSAVLISIAMMFRGLREWTNAAWVRDDLEEPDKRKDKDFNTPTPEKWTYRRRPVIQILSIMVFTHILGLVLFSIITRSWFLENRRVLAPILLLVLSTAPLVALLIPQPNRTTAPPSTLLKGLNLCFASTVISITTVLNFSLAASLAILLGIPLSLSSPSSHPISRLTKYIAYILLGFGWLVVGQDEMRQAIWDWEILAVWFAPFMCMVYAPLVLQGGLVCLIP